MNTKRTKELLKTREDSHGSFDINAATGQAIKSVLRSQRDWTKLTAPQQEALDYIASKIGRIMSGNPNHVDHWDDIAGYAQLISNRIRGEKDA